MIKGFKTKIYPNQEQKEKIIKFCNASRFSYNWSLNVESDNYEQGNKFLSGYDLAKIFTQFRNQEGNEWLKEKSSYLEKLLQCGGTMFICASKEQSPKDRH